MKKKELLQILLLAERNFRGSEYEPIVNLSLELFNRGCYDLCERELSKLPTADKLLDDLVEKLKGKSVYKTLRKIQNGCSDDSIITAKGLSSLLTHVLIECERSPEYRILVPSILDKLNEVIFRVL